MRVISGRAKGFKLKKVPGDTTRPITDRVKENLFNILGDWVRDTRWLDLFAGTGQVGIEALSRGAKSVLFIDSARPAITTIQRNLDHTKLADSGTLMKLDAFRYLAQPPSSCFDVIYVAPPQYKDLWEQVLGIVDNDAERWLSETGTVIVQIDPKEYKELQLTLLELVDQRSYGRTMLCFYELVVSSEI